jgi:hypothetical protein
VIHKNKVVLTPEARDKKGMFYSTEKNPKDNYWIAEMEVNMGNEKKTHRGGTGMAFYYLRNLD